MSEAGALAGQRCLVIGAGSDIGLAVVDQLVIDGAVCHATTRRAPAKGMRAGPAASVRWSVCDVRDPENVARTVHAAIDGLGHLDAVVYCPALAAVGPVLGVDPAQWTEVYEVNTRGFALAVQAGLEHWTARGSGCCVALSSQAARRGQALLAPYTASKAALEGLIRALAIELAPVVRLNAVAPGIVPTKMIALDFARQAHALGTSVADVEQRTLRRIPLRRFQSGQAVAAAVAYLLSPAARDVTGQVLAVDGGMTA